MEEGECWELAVAHSKPFTLETARFPIWAFCYWELSNGKCLEELLAHSSLSVSSYSVPQDRAPGVCLFQL